MANIANFEVNGVSYSYDTESRNPLSNKVKAKAIEGELVYDINTNAPTEVVGIPANSLKEVEEAEDLREVRELIFYAMYDCMAFPVGIKYKGSIKNTDGQPLVKGVLTIGDEETREFETSCFQYDDNGWSWSYGNSEGKLSDDSEDEGFEIVEICKDPYYWSSTTNKIEVTEVEF